MLIPGWLNVLVPPTRLIGDSAAVAADWRASAADEYCGRCGATVASAAVTLDGCPHCRGESLPWHGVWRLGAYEPPLSQWICDCKFHRAWGWARWFGRNLARAVARGGADEAPGRTVIVPVPLHWRRRWQRGYDQARLMAAHFGEARRLPVAPLLVRRRATRPQSHLPASARRKNVARAFALRAPVDLRGTTIWLIDDVKTSGFTARNCARLLKKAGALRVNLAVAAVADPHAMSFHHVQPIPTDPPLHGDR